MTTKRVNLTADWVKLVDTATNPFLNVGATGTAIIGNVELFLNRTISQVRSLPPTFKD